MAADRVPLPPPRLRVALRRRRLANSDRSAGKRYAPMRSVATGRDPDATQNTKTGPGRTPLSPPSSDRHESESCVYLGSCDVAALPRSVAAAINIAEFLSSFFRLFSYFTSSSWVHRVFLIIICCGLEGTTNGIEPPAELLMDFGGR